jgi:hypothetical protein
MPNNIHTCVWEGYHSGAADKCITLPPTPGKEYPKDWIICPAQPFDVCVPMADRNENRCVERMWLHWNPQEEPMKGLKLGFMDKMALWVTEDMPAGINWATDNWEPFKVLGSAVTSILGPHDDEFDSE